MLRWFRMFFNPRPATRTAVSRTGHGQTGTPLTSDIRRNVEMVKNSFGDSADIVVREMPGTSANTPSMALIHIDGLVCQELVAEVLLARIADHQDEWRDPRQAFQALKGRVVSVSQVRETTVLEELVEQLCAGGCAILVESYPEALLCEVRGWPHRAIEEPITEPTVRGPKEGFSETLRTNTSLLRRRIKSSDLRIEQIKIGRITRTDVAVVYIATVVNQKVLGEVRRRLSKIDVDSIQESGHLEELIEDSHWSPFPTILRTERPDKAVGNLLEGRVVIITDGTPFVLIVPATLTMFLSAPEDYFERFLIGTLLRIVRFTAFLLSFTLSSLYVAVTTFHQEMLPTNLLWAIASQREGIPFPTVVEVLIMEAIFEVLREAGIRLPPVVGQTVSIIGVLVLGDAATRAGLASPATIVVLAASGVSSFAAPTFSIGIAARMLRFIMILLGGTMGLFGIISGLFTLFLHLTTLRSFGMPYLTPYSPFIASDMKDAAFRAPWWATRKRPALLSDRNPTRSSRRLKATFHRS